MFFFNLLLEFLSLESSTCNWKSGLAARRSKANKEARLVEREVCFIWDAGNQGWESGGRAVSCPKADSLPLQPVGKSFYRLREGLHAETAQAALTVILKLVIHGLTSVILIVLGTVSFQFQGQFVPIYLRLVLGTGAAYAMATVWSSCS